MNLPAKQTLKEELLRVGEKNLEAAEQAHRATVEAATHEEAKPENDKDTRALEQTYLARGQAMRAEALVEQIQFLRSIDLAPRPKTVIAGALVALADDDGTRCLFFAPHG